MLTIKRQSSLRLRIVSQAPLLFIILEYNSQPYYMQTFNFLASLFIWAGALRLIWLETQIFSFLSDKAQWVVELSTLSDLWYQVSR